MRTSANFRIKRHYSVLAHGPDVVEIRRGVWNPVSFTLTDDSKSGQLYDVLRRFDGSSSVAEIAKLAKVPRSDVEALIDHLIQLGVLETTAQNPIDRYLDELSGGPSAISPASESPPILFMGDPVLAAETERYVRASLPGLSTKTLSPSDAAWTALGAADDSWLFDGLQFHDQVSLFEDWRGHLLVLVDKLIDPPRFQALNRIALELATPWMHSVLDGPFVLVGPLFVPQRTACYECFEQRVAMNLRENASYQRYKAALTHGLVTKGPNPVEPALVGLLASHSALEVAAYCVTNYSVCMGKTLAIYLPSMEFHYSEVLRLPGCTACAPTPDRDDHDLYFDLRALLPR